MGLSAAQLGKLCCGKSKLISYRAFELYVQGGRDTPQEFDCFLTFKCRTAYTNLMGRCTYLDPPRIPLRSLCLIRIFLNNPESFVNQGFWEQSRHKP